MDEIEHVINDWEITAATIRDKSLHISYRKVYEDYYNWLLCEAPVEYVASQSKEIQGLVQDVRNVLKQRKEVATSGYYWITCTVNPSKSTATLERLKFKIEKAVKKKCLKRSIYNFELTKEGRPHVHCLTEVDPSCISDSKFRNSWKNTFKDVGHVLIKRCRNAWVDDKVAYLMGQKDDPEKQDMIEADKVWREEEGLEPIYKVNWDEEGGDLHLDEPPDSDSDSDE